MGKKQQFIICALIVVSVFAVDVFTKYLAFSYLSGSTVLPITSFFNIVLTLNRGVSFAMFKAQDIQGVYVLIGLTSVLSLLVLYLLITIKSMGERLGYALVFAGAVGNLFDRIRLNGVIDFLDFHWRGYHWPAFNIADSAICIGVGLLFIYHFLLQKKA